ncbi:MAG: PhoH family protein [Bacteroidetes bacterium]|nr:PhoH family protein [Bacteroidota bacterium]
MASDNNNQDFSGEKTFQLEGIHPSDIFGMKEEKLQLICRIFPKLKIVLRGDLLKVIGEEDDIAFFDKKFTRILNYYEKFGKIPEEIILEIISDEQDSMPIDNMGPVSSEVLVHGRDGMLIKARTPNQARMVESFKTHDMLFAIGPAGTGKTYTAVALAVRALKNKEVKRIILTRPAVEAGENLGFLPGDLKEKLDPYLQPLYDALRDMIPPFKLESYIEDGTIEIAPLAFMRGRTLDNAFAILDEAQNATTNQLKMFLTRMGKSAKFLITGDITQIDLPKNQASGLISAIKILNQVKGVEFVFLNEKDVVRHPLVTKIITAYKQNEGD